MTRTRPELPKLSSGYKTLTDLMPTQSLRETYLVKSSDQLHVTHKWHEFTCPWAYLFIKDSMYRYKDKVTATKVTINVRLCEFFGGRV